MEVPLLLGPGFGQLLLQKKSLEACKYFREKGVFHDVMLCYAAKLQGNGAVDDRFSEKGCFRRKQAKNIACFSNKSTTYHAKAKGGKERRIYKYMCYPRYVF